MFVARWSDERALVASPLLLVSSWYFYRAVPNHPVGRRSEINGAVGGMIFGMLAHAFSRLAYSSWAGVPHRYDGNGLGIFLNQMNNMPMGVRTSLERGWIPVAAAMLIAWRRGWPVWSLCYFCAIGIVLAVSLAVVDISRTTAFVLPALFASLAILKESETVENYRRIVFLSSAVSMLWPMYYVGGKSTIWWVYPLPIQVIRLISGR